MIINKIENIVNLSFWVVYGDVLGFIFELVDCSLLVKRIG